MLNEINGLFGALKDLQDSKRETQRVKEWADAETAKAEAGLRRAKAERRKAEENSRRFNRELEDFKKNAAPLRKRQAELLKKGADLSPAEFQEFLDLSRQLSDMFPSA